jgi:hypothetical protein
MSSAGLCLSKHYPSNFPLAPCGVRDAEAAQVTDVWLVLHVFESIAPRHIAAYPRTRVPATVPSGPVPELSCYKER